MIDLATAGGLVAAAHEHAAALGVRVSAAVVDAGGHLIAFGRMDGAEIAGPTLAVDKAYTAVAQSTSTAELAVLAAPGGPLFGLQANGGGRYVIFAGGIPLVDGDRIVGAVGVSGAAVDEDEACAAAAVAAWRGHPPATVDAESEVPTIGRGPYPLLRTPRPIAPRAVR